MYTCTCNIDYDCGIVVSLVTCKSHLFCLFVCVSVCLSVCLQVVQRVSIPGFLCRRHTITRVKEHPLQKIDTIFARPVDKGEVEVSMCLWSWSRQDMERNFSILDVQKGVFSLPEKNSPGGRVYAMAATGEIHKRIWTATAVSRNHPVSAWSSLYH